MKINPAHPFRALAVLGLLTSSAAFAVETDATSAMNEDAKAVATSTEATDDAKAEPALTATKFDSVIGSDVLPGLKLPALMDPNVQQPGC